MEWIGNASVLIGGTAGALIGFVVIGLIFLLMLAPITRWLDQDGPEDTLDGGDRIPDRVQPDEASPSDTISPPGQPRRI